MSKTLRDLAAATQYRRFSSEQDLDTFIRDRFPRASAEEKIAMKLTLAAEKKFSLAAQAETYRPGESSIDKSLRELGIHGPVSLDDLERQMDALSWGATLRIAAKIQLQQKGWLTYGAGHRMSAQLATDQSYAPGTLATDRSRYTPAMAPVGREMASLLRKTGLSVDQSYSDAEVSEALDRSGLDTMSRIAVRHLLGERGCLRKG